MICRSFSPGIFVGVETCRFTCLTVFYPAPGFRDSGYYGGYGTLYAVSSYGYSWSSTIPTGNTSAHSLNFSYGRIYPNNSNYRSYGFQLRCLQE
ncbi:MAG: hypothetical protein K2K83_05870 [Rikenella sp.]|nr:hypothetical protein [Rikenella sp.]